MTDELADDPSAADNVNGEGDEVDDERGRGNGRGRNGADMMWMGQQLTPRLV